MNTVIGVKQIQSSPMTRGDYNKYRGWKMPKDENPLEPGFLVEYEGDTSNHENHEGYISWTPLKPYLKAYRSSGSLPAGYVVELLKQGKRLRRQGWSEDKKFIFEQVPSTINKDIVPNMQSLPQEVKDYFAWTFTEESGEQIDSIYYMNQIAIVTLSNVIMGYTMTAEDLLAEDWVIL